MLELIRAASGAFIVSMLALLCAAPGAAHAADSSDTDVAKVAGENVLRVMAAAEQVAARLRATRPASEARP